MTCDSLTHQAKLSRGTSVIDCMSTMVRALGSQADDFYNELNVFLVKFVLVLTFQLTYLFVFW